MTAAVDANSMFRLRQYMGVAKACSTALQSCQRAQEAQACLSMLAKQLDAMSPATELTQKLRSLTFLKLQVGRAMLSM